MAAAARPDAGSSLRGEDAYRHAGMAGCRAARKQLGDPRRCAYAKFTTWSAQAHASDEQENEQGQERLCAEAYGPNGERAGDVNGSGVRCA